MARNTQHSAFSNFSLNRLKRMTACNQFRNVMLLKPGVNMVKFQQAWIFFATFYTWMRRKVIPNIRSGSVPSFVSIFVNASFVFLAFFGIAGFVKFAHTIAAMFLPRAQQFIVIGKFFNWFRLPTMGTLLYQFSPLVLPEKQKPHIGGYEASWRYFLCTP
jgi:hypothetical protein